MRYVQRSMGPAREINTGRFNRRPIWRTALILVVGIAIAYCILLIASDLFARYVPASWEARLKPLFAGVGEPASGYERQAGVARDVLARIERARTLRELPYEITIIDDADPNAFALPGGTILITTGLMDVIGSEESLAMVIGHELGHFAHRDQLRSMGKWMFLSMAIGGLLGNTQLSGAVSTLAELGELRHSRKQELAADRFGLDCVIATYGHAGGAVEFFEGIEAAERAQPGVFQYFSTHPVPADRIARLNERIADKNALLLATTPLGFDGPDRD